LPSLAVPCAVALSLAATTQAQAQETKVAIGISGWTGFAPLTLAKEAGLFKKHGLDVSIKKIPQKDRHLAIASGDIQCAATTVETWVVWNANGVATTQIFQLDKSFGADGMVVKSNISKISDLKGKTVAADAPGTAPYFGLAWILKKNGMTIKDVKVVNLSPQAAANAMIAGTGGIDAAMTHEPYLGAIRDKPEAGKIIATTLDYPMVMDEPFGALDHQTRELMQELLLGIWEAERTTVLFVTHDIDEAIFMGSRVVVMSARPGRIKLDRQIDLPHPRHYAMKTTAVFSSLKAELTEAVRREVLAAQAAAVAQG